MHETIRIATADGTCPAHVFTPARGSGPWPGAIVFMDGVGIRPVLFEMGQRLADAGYLVLLPDMYYRFGPYAPVDVAAMEADWSKPSPIRQMIATTSRARAVADAAAFLGWFGSRADWNHGKLGATGYCMGGGMALCVAAAYPDSFGAVASFHGGNLVSDDADSPHRLLPKITAKIHVAAAVEDQWYPPEQDRQFRAAVAAAGVDARCEFYEGAHHSWTMKDMAAWNEAAAERHWRELFALFKDTIG